MKKMVLFSLSGLSFLFSIAQHSEWGLTTSFSGSKVSGDGMNGSVKAGYSAGAYAILGISKKWGIQPKFLFAQKNIQTSTDFQKIFPEETSGNFNTQVSLHYVSIPLLLNYKFNNSWSINLGPQYSYLLSSDEELLKDKKQAFDNKDISIVGGAQLQFSSIRMYAQYNYGIHNVNSMPDNKHSWFLRSIEIGIALRLVQG